mmetsp:Transcript_3383/g.10523  ORF Transcript_3383/g.10523 Transcript_3383/m.10523 type:complete len:203 (+) Transcript_3383:1958-2566(+)
MAASGPPSAPWQRMQDSASSIEAISPRLEPGAPRCGEAASPSSREAPASPAPPDCSAARAASKEEACFDRAASAFCLACARRRCRRSFSCSASPPSPPAPGSGEAACCTRCQRCLSRSRLLSGSRRAASESTHRRSRNPRRERRKSAPPPAPPAAPPAAAAAATLSAGSFVRPCLRLPHACSTVAAGLRCAATTAGAATRAC